MNIGDDVTINGKIIHIKHAKGLNTELIYVRVKINDYTCDVDCDEDLERLKEVVK